ncbi:MAG: DUF192 domain-containing protein [Candidatus Sericytochromatia bacterium]|nr:DUF192 domain-containing protein [Candidatus Sericytochromatia bacterium]
MSRPTWCAVTVAPTGTPLAPRTRVADRWWPRLVGLLATPALAPGDGLLLVPCNAVHALGMRYAIDVAYLDRAGTVLHVTHGLRPGTVGWPVRGARAVLELPEGALQAAGVRVGDRLEGLPPL